MYQEDNAGPHTEAGYTQWLRDTFDALGWKLELQAPQGTCPSLLSLYYVTLTPITPCIGPYTNVLDLQLFPSMSHRHSAQLQLYNNTEATIEKIWQTVENVWNETSSAEVARAFVLAYRVMDVIIDENGDNNFLSSGTPHCNVRRDFCDTPTGVRRKLASLFL